ncbi:MAG: hypothetical protein IJ890_02830 [Clostridia bacterium]|nr:hypothetical protein [Clostridia bacterium]
MKNLNNLNQKLKNLQSQKKNFSSINDISLMQFLKFKSILSKEKKISKQIDNTISQGNEINFWYDSTTKSWIENPHINCRKYYKLENNAAYKKDLKLYKLGLSSRKPIHPLIQKLERLLSPITNFIKENYSKIKPKLSKCNFFKKFYQKYNYFKSQTLPKNINKLAVDTASIGIKGYRHLKSNCRYIRNSITSKDSFKYLKNVINQANNKIDNYENQKNFRESLKIENFKSVSDNYNDSNMINNKIHEYSLSR